MNDSLITVRYVKALYQLAYETKFHENVKSDIETMLSCIQGSHEFVFFIETPLIKSNEKKHIIDEMFSKRLNDLTLRFLHLLVEKRREMYLKSICLYFLHYYKILLGIKEAVITTAKPLARQHRDEIFDFISRKFKVTIELSEKVNPDIIGGFILQIEDQRINASLRNQLNKIKRELIHT